MSFFFASPQVIYPYRYDLCKKFALEYLMLRHDLCKKFALEYLMLRPL
jgi:hypothetical protein